MELTIEQALQQGIEAHKEGKVQDAEILYRNILKSQPLHPDANHNLGVIAVSVGKTNLALTLFKTALEINPKIEQFWISYINALLKEKQFDEAKKVFEKAKNQGINEEKLNSLNAQIMSLPESETADNTSPPQIKLSKLLDKYQKGQYDEAENFARSLSLKYLNDNFSWKILGAILKKTDRLSESLIAYQKAVEINPIDAEAHNNLGNTYKELNKLDKAEESLKQAIILKPDYAEACNNLGNLLKELDKLEEAEVNYKKAIALKPDFAEAHNSLGITLKYLDRLDEAEINYRKAIELKPEYAEAHYNLGIMLNELGRLDDAEASYNQAIALKPDFPKAHNNLGNIHKDLGRLNDAVANYKQAIVLKPNYAEAHRHLASMKRFNRQDEQYLKMQELYIDKNISEEECCHINFGLAKACEDLGNFQQAFTHYSEGNKLRKKLLSYDINQDEALFMQIKANYPQIEHNSLEPDKLSKNLTPIFIVGMPRSGTTLVEQIISSHSQVTGAGELAFATQFGEAIALGLSEANNESLLDFRSKYLTKLKSVSNGNLIITDKMPQNFRYIGLLAAAFPEAKIIHVKRNPAAVCWANYKQYFESKNIGYCYAIDDVIIYHKLYENLMEFWTNTLTNRIYKLDYELLTVNQESETRQLIDYLDLDWDEKYLSPQNNRRSVATASNLQIRKKVYRGSSEQWRKYQSFLNGAFDDLLLS